MRATHASNGQRDRWVVEASRRNLVPDTDARKPFVVELVGPAGVGKTTVLHALCQRDSRVVAGVPLSRGVLALSVMATAPVLMRLLFSRRRSDERLSWGHARSMAYLRGWRQVLRRGKPRGGAVVVLDHGPVFRLAMLRGFGPGAARSESFDRWWDLMLDRWAPTLDLVVSLDAPDDVLVDRIDLRERHHRIKDRPEGEARRFLARYRVAYSEVLAGMATRHGPPVLRLDTDTSPVDRVADALLAEIDSRLANPALPRCTMTSGTRPAGPNAAGSNVGLER